MQRMILGMVAVVMLASTAPAALAANQEVSGYAGSTLSFDATSNALVDYSVGGATTAESIRVQSQSEAESGLGLGVSADLGAVVNLTGAAVSVDSSTETGATVRSDSGATLSAHDDGHGSLVVESDGEPQYVEIGLNARSSAQADGDSRVVVTTADGTQGSVVVVGDGEVTVNDQGNVSAALDGDDRLVFRSYPDGRDDGDRETERLIADGHAAAAVYATGDGTGVVSYDGDTDVRVTGEGENHLTMEVERSSHEGRVVIATVAEETISSAEDASVTVDGEAAARASSYGELRGATQDGDTSMYMIQQGEASGSADVLVGVNHFSTREVTVSDGNSASDGGSGGDGGAAGGEGNSPDAGTEPSSGLGPGFGVVGALAALTAGGAYLARRRG